MREIDVNLSEYAKYFHKMGLNVTCISNYRNVNNITDNNLLKSPNHNWSHFSTIRQKSSEVVKYNWEDACGIGVVLGYNGLMAIDIDGCVEYKFVEFICNILGIPKGYPWITISGSRSGFHILIRCQNMVVDREKYKKDLESERFENVDDWGVPEVNAYYPKKVTSKVEFGYNTNYESEELTKDLLLGFYFVDLFNNFRLEDLFNKIEFRWGNHLVLPPSLHASGLSYKFKNEMPSELPIEINFQKLTTLKEKICSLSAEISGYDAFRANLAISDDKSQKRGFENKPMFLIFDTETNGLPKNYKESFENLDNWPRLVELSWCILDQNNNVIKRETSIIKPIGFEIENSSALIHGINQNIANMIGNDLKDTLEKFLEDIISVKTVVAHNYDFDSKVLLAEMIRTGHNTAIFKNKKHICTMVASANYCGIKNEFGIKFPTLSELYFKLFNKDLMSIHNSVYDIVITTFCFSKLRELNIISNR